jgi:hypothetical protein
MWALGSELWIQGTADVPCVRILASAAVWFRETELTQGISNSVLLLQPGCGSCQSSGTVFDWDLSCVWRDLNGRCRTTGLGSVPWNKGRKRLEQLHVQQGWKSRSCAISDAGRSCGERETQGRWSSVCGVESSQHLAVLPSNSKSNLCFVRQDVRGLGKEEVLGSAPLPSDLAFSDSGNYL